MVQNGDDCVAYYNDIKYEYGTNYRELRSSVQKTLETVCELLSKSSERKKNIVETKQVFERYFDLSVDPYIFDYSLMYKLQNLAIMRGAFEYTRGLVEKGLKDLRGKDVDDILKLNRNLAVQEKVWDGILYGVVMIPESKLLCYSVDSDCELENIPADTYLEFDNNVLGIENEDLSEKAICDDGTVFILDTKDNLQILRGYYGIDI